MTPTATSDVLAADAIEWLESEHDNANDSDAEVFAFAIDAIRERDEHAVMKAYWEGRALHAEARTRLVEAERDSARRMWCEDQPCVGHDNWPTAEAAAQSNGWGYLYETDAGRNRAPDLRPVTQSDVAFSGDDWLQRAIDAGCLVMDDGRWIRLSVERDADQGAQEPREERFSGELGRMLSEALGVPLHRGVVSISSADLDAFERRLVVRGSPVLCGAGLMPDLASRLYDDILRRRERGTPEGAPPPGWELVESDGSYWCERAAEVTGPSRAKADAMADAWRIHERARYETERSAQPDEWTDVDAIADGFLGVTRQRVDQVVTQLGLRSSERHYRHGKPQVSRHALGLVRRELASRGYRESAPPRIDATVRVDLDRGMLWVLGRPSDVEPPGVADEDDGDPRLHHCDAMGCPSVGAHTLAVARLWADPEGGSPPEYPLWCIDTRQEHEHRYRGPWASLAGKTMEEGELPRRCRRARPDEVIGTWQGFVDEIVEEVCDASLWLDIDDCWADWDSSLVDAKPGAAAALAAWAEEFLQVKVYVNEPERSSPPSDEESERP